MALGLTSVAFLVIAIFILFAIRSFVGPKPTRNGSALPSPPGTIPILGNGLTLLRPRLDLFSIFSDWERLHGYETLSLSVPTLPPGVLVHDPQVLEFIFRHEGDIFTKGDFVRHRSWDLFGQGIINVDGSVWRAQRRAGLDFLNSANLDVMIQVVLPRFLKDAVDAVSEAAEKAITIDLQAIFLGITTRLMGHMAYGIDLRAHDEFTVAFDYASGITAERFQNPLWAVKELLLLGKMTKALSVVKEFGAYIVSSGNGLSSSTVNRWPPNERKANDELEEVPGTLLQALLASIGDQKAVIDAALNYLSAGRDTTAQALTWAFYLLCKHDKVLERLRNEAVDVLKKGQEIQQDDGRSRGVVDGICPSLFTPARMQYTTAVVYETLRLYPPVPFEIKQAKSSTTLPDGTHIPAGSLMAWCLWSMGRSTMTWGPDADDFNPDRWIHQGRFRGRSQSEFPVFNGGPRVCLGKKMAEAVAVQVLAVMALLYDFVPHREDAGISGSSLTLPKQGGFLCYPQRRATSLPGQ